MKKNFSKYSWFLAILLPGGLLIFFFRKQIAELFKKWFDKTPAKKKYKPLPFTHTGHELENLTYEDFKKPYQQPLPQ